MEKEADIVQPNEQEKKAHKFKTKLKENGKKILFAGGIVLLIGIGVAWKCWDGQRLDFRKLSNDELKEMRNRLQDVILSPNSDQESKKECIHWVNVIDNIVRARDPIDRKNYVYPKGGEHGTNLWKPD